MIKSIGAIAILIVRFWDFHKFVRILPTRSERIIVQTPLEQCLATHYHLDISQRTSDIIMITVTRGTDAAVLQKPVVCGKCKTTHFTFQLSCKKCGDYLGIEDMVMPASNGAMKVAISIMVLGLAIFGVCKYLHVL